MSNRVIRAAVVVAWCAFAAYVALVLTARGDWLGYVQALGWGVLAAGEAVALWHGVNDEDTISERITAWLRGRPVRMALLVIGMTVLTIHWIVGYP